MRHTVVFPLDKPFDEPADSDELVRTVSIEMSTEQLDALLPVSPEKLERIRAAVEKNINRRMLEDLIRGLG